jgi:hypothetical protein
LNSTLFSGGDSRVRLVPFLRAPALLNTPDSVSGLIGQYCSAAPGFVGSASVPAKVFFLRRHSKIVYSSQRSLRGMGMRVSDHVLALSGLRRREAFCAPLPCPPLPSTEAGGSLPKGAVSVPCHYLHRSFLAVCRSWEREVFFPSVAALARIDYRVRSPHPEDYWTRVRRGTTRWVRPKPHILRQLSSWCRLLGSRGVRADATVRAPRAQVWLPGERLVGRLGLGHWDFGVDYAALAWGG